MPIKVQRLFMANKEHVNIQYEDFIGKVFSLVRTKFLSVRIQVSGSEACIVHAPILVFARLRDTHDVFGYEAHTVCRFLQDGNKVANGDYVLN